MIQKILVSLLFVCSLIIANTALGQNQQTIDEKILTDYFAKNKIKATRTPSGLYYTIHKPGDGANAKAGTRATMYYYGYTLDGRRFDSNMDQSYNPAGNPFTFNVGAHQVIKGWDEGVQYLNKGCRATFYLPSGLAYGQTGSGSVIAPNAVLAFDVELVSMQ